MALERITELDDLWEGEMRPCKVRGHNILLLRLENGVYAYADRCAHLGVALNTGRLQDGILICSAHHFEYDARTGCGINPRTVCLKSYPLTIMDEAVWIEI